jgi:hypothetical protein
MGKTTADATTTAKQYVVDNLGANATAAFNLPSPLSSFMATNTGTGSGLTHGVEIVNGDVRVALTAPAFTYFMRVGGINTYNVRARTRCDATHGGGVLPVAVNRFPGYDRNNTRRLGIADIVQTLPQYYGAGKQPKPLTVRDVLQQGQGILNQNGQVSSTACDSDRRNWYDWPSAGSLTSHTGPYHDACTAASSANPGPEVEMLGSGASPNIGGASFTGQIVLDARQIGTSPVFYNGLSGTSSINTWKGTVAQYAVTQYPGPDLVPGDQVGILNGVSAGQLLSVIGTRFRPDDVVTASVYDGKVRTKQDFLISLTCTQGQGPTTSGSDPSCNNTGAGGSYVYRDAPPAADTSFFNGACNFRGDYYIADPTVFASMGSSLQGGTSFQPAKYVVRLAATDTAVTVQLSARLSGPNSGAGGAGAPDDFGTMRVRWLSSSGTALTGWQNPNTAYSVNVPTAGVSLNLEVIQTATTTRLCGLTSVMVPNRVYGAHTIQVSGRVVGQLLAHSAYGVLGMKNTANSFDAGDYFLSFVNDPFGTIRGGGTLDAKLQFIDANADPATGTELSFGSLPSSPSTSWYNADGGAVPAGLSATFVQDSAGDSALRVTVPQGTAAGLYYVDAQWNTAPVHSARFYLRIPSDTSSSIDSWVTVLCYARFKITNVGSNVIKGRAVLGCLDPSTNPQGLLSTSRQRAW